MVAKVVIVLVVSVLVVGCAVGAWLVTHPSAIDGGGGSQPTEEGWHLTRIVMHTREGCDPCAVWKAEELPKAKADGVLVEFARGDRRGTPAFDAYYCNGDQCVTKKFSNVPYSKMKNYDPSNRGSDGDDEEPGEGAPAAPVAPD